MDTAFIYTIKAGEDAPLRARALTRRYVPAHDLESADETRSRETGLIWKE